MIRTPLSHFRDSPLLRKRFFGQALLLSGLLLSGLSLTASVSQAQVITIGVGGSGNLFPFGVNSQGASYQGEYQQIYSSTAFSAPITITQIAFTSFSGSPPPGSSYSFTGTIALGTTSASPAAPGSSYAANKRSDFLTVFNSTQNATLTANGTTFDLLFNITPFVYDPSAGNLLLDVVTTSVVAPNSTLFVSTPDGNDPLTGRLYTVPGGPAGASPTAGANGGLRTRFSGTAVTPGVAPEPGSLALLLPALGIVGMVIRKRRKK